MKLTQGQAETLAHARVNADISVPELAKKCSLSAVSVRGALSRLEDRGIIRKAALFNLSKLGFVEYDLLCALNEVGREKKKKLFEFLFASPLVTFVLETGGDYHLVMTVSASSPTIVDRFLSHISENFGDIFREIENLVMLGRTIFGPKFLAKKNKPQEFVTISPQDELKQYDSIDRRILKSLSRDADQSVRALSRSLGVPHSTIGDRLRGLKTSGVWLGNFWSFNAQALGLSEYRVTLGLRGLGSELKNEVFQFALSHDYVTYSLTYLGRWQFCLGIVVPDAAKASEVVNELEESFRSKISQISLFPVMGDRKVELFPMFEEGSGPIPIPPSERPASFLQ